MNIDWFTVIAQGINFVILVWLMKRFLYKPVLQAIDERDKSIARQLQDAEAKQAAAAGEQDEFRKKNEALERERSLRVARMEEEIRATRERLLEEVRKESAMLRSKLQENLRQEQQQMNEEVALHLREEILAVTGKVLSDLASDTLNERIAGVFVRKLRTLDGNARQQLSVGLRKSSVPVVVRTAFELPEDQKEHLVQAVKEIFTDASVRFEIAPDQIGGIEMVSNNYRLSWNIRDYLSSFGKEVGRLLEENGRTVTMENNIPGNDPATR